MAKEKIVYECAFCNTKHTNMSKAEICEQSHIEVISSSISISTVIKVDCLPGEFIYKPPISERTQEYEDRQMLMEIASKMTNIKRSQFSGLESAIASILTIGNYLKVDIVEDIYVRIER